MKFPELLQPYMYIWSFLREVTVEVFPLSSYARSFLDVFSILKSSSLCKVKQPGWVFHFSS